MVLASEDGRVVGAYSILVVFSILPSPSHPVAERDGSETEKTAGGR